MSDSPKQADRELKNFEKAQALAEKEADLNVLKPEIRFATVLKTFEFPVEPTAADFEELYKLRREHYVKICSLLLAITKEDGTSKIHVPVTPRCKEKVDQQTFHSISITRGDGAILEILIREYDNYIVAFRVYLTPEDKEATLWCTLGENLPGSFGKVNPTKYGSGHVKLEKVQFGAGILLKIFKFLQDLQNEPDQTTTEDGQRFICTLFILFGEAQRFSKARQWVIAGVDSDRALTPDGPLILLFRDWKGLSKTGVQLYLALAEKTLKDKYKARHEHEKGYENPFDTVDEAKVACVVKEKVHQKVGLRVRSVQTNEVELSCLLGGEIFLVKHDKEFCSKVLIREKGFDGAWPDKVVWK